tara:strand:+ start:39928 stop:40341 length:414 start_codon:yes stop_codon:yes gene_type:complete
MNTNKTYYLISLILFSLAIIGAVANSIINYDVEVLKFIKLGYPTYLIQVIATAQLLGLIIIITKQGKWLVEWAYAGLFMNMLFGIIAHLLARDGNGATAVLCLIIVWITYVFEKKVRYEIKVTKKEKQPYTNLEKVI